MELLPGFFRNMMEAREFRANQLGPKTIFTMPEITVEAAMSALSVASLDGQDQIEIQRRAELIKNSKVMESVVKKIDQQLGK